MKKFRKAKAPEPIPTYQYDPSTVTMLNPSPAPALVSPTSVKKPSASRWKKGGKKQADVKPEFDLSSALPSSDNFRTSLLMPNLSARFSMLREQDDPNSLLGKASDDSVLQPRRKSRLMDYGFSGPALADIAEVASINGSIRPPFAMRQHSGSIASEDGYNSDFDPSTSMMSRARPGEGNNLFGGRQKVYRIPLSGANASSKSLGKAVYEDDIVVSPFMQSRQRDRERERERERELRERLGRTSGEDSSLGFDFGLDAHAMPGAEQYLPHDSAKDLTHSPSLFSYDKKRSTASSIARSDTRSSTAATSVASQPVNSNTPSPAPGRSNSGTTSPANVPMVGAVADRPAPKSRRLYENGLEQSMHEQQNSAISRLNSLQRPRGFSKQGQQPFLHSTKSAGNLHDRPQQQVYAMQPSQAPSPRAKGPPPITISRQASSNGPSSPGSPLNLNADDSNPLANSIRAADKGKATAMGAFNMPKHGFSEDKYFERQQLQRSTSNNFIRPQQQPLNPLQSVVQQRTEQYEEDERRARDESQLMSRERSPSGSKSFDAPRPYDIFQNAANAMPNKPPISQHPAHANRFPDPHRTFFGNISASESEDEEDDSHTGHSFSNDAGFPGYNGGRWHPSPLPPVSEHPAFRGQYNRDILEEEEEEEESAKLQPRPLRTMPSIKSIPEQAKQSESSQTLDSPTLGGQTAPLGSMMRHLRQKSNASSMYPADDIPLDETVPDLPEIPWNGPQTDAQGRNMSLATESSSRHDSNYTSSNPWDLEERPSMQVSRASISPVEPTYRNGSHAASNFDNRHSDVSALDHTPNASRTDNDYPAWQQDQRRTHTRDISNDTLQEREAFDNQLAARRQAIQENMKSVIERSRDNSPAPAASSPFKAFGMLGRKPSGDVPTTNGLQNAPSKALKMLGANHPSTTSLHSQLAHDSSRPRNNSSSRPSLSNNQFPSYSSVPEPMPEFDIPGARADHPSERTLSSVTAAPRARSRSNSNNTTGRSRSRTGPYRDDLDKAMVEGIGSSGMNRPGMPRELTPRPSPHLGSPNYEGNNGTNGYFDSRGFPAGQNGVDGHVITNGNTSNNVASVGSYNPGRPAPVANPFSSNATPPLSSGPSTPLPSASSPMVGSGSMHQSNNSRSGLANGVFSTTASLRKKTISKADISEPTLIASTSNIDTVDLPEGASLRNGMEADAAVAPPIPPINPKRRGTGSRKLWGLGVVGGGSGSGTDKSMPKEEEFASWRSPSGSAKAVSPPWTGAFPAHASLSRGLPSQQMQYQNERNGSMEVSPERRRIDAEGEMF